MKKPGTRILVACLLMLCCGCASLTKSQLDEVNRFGQSAKTFSAYPAKVMGTLVDVHTQSQYFQVGIIVDPDLHRQHVDSIYKWIQTSRKKDEEIALVFQIVSDYGQKLVHLTAHEHSLQLDTAAQSFGTNLDSLIGKFNAIDTKHAVPTGYGALIGEIISFGGDMYIHDRQAKRAKAFVTKGDTLIGTMALKLEQFLEADGIRSVKDGITRERKNLVRDYTSYLKSDNELINLYYKTDKQSKNGADAPKDTVITGTLKAWRTSGMGADSLYIKLLTNLDTDEALRLQCLAAVKNLRKAHHKLMEDLQEKKELKDVYPELKDYGSSLMAMYSTSKKIK